MEIYREATGPLKCVNAGRKNDITTIFTSCPLAKTQDVTDEDDSVLQPRWKTVMWAR